VLHHGLSPLSLVSCCFPAPAGLSVFLQDRSRRLCEREAQGLCLNRFTRLERVLWRGASWVESSSLVIFAAEARRLSGSSSSGLRRAVRESSVPPSGSRLIRLARRDPRRVERAALKCAALAYCLAFMIVRQVFRSCQPFN